MRLYLFIYQSKGTMETRANDVTTPTGLRHRVGALRFRVPRNCAATSTSLSVSAIDLFCAGNGRVPFATKLDKPASSGAHSVRTAVYRLPLRAKVSNGCLVLFKALCSFKFVLERNFLFFGLENETIWANVTMTAAASWYL